VSQNEIYKEELSGSQKRKTRFIPFAWRRTRGPKPAYWH